jgi:hypothetical protein
MLVAFFSVSASVAGAQRVIYVDADAIGPEVDGTS